MSLEMRGALVGWRNHSVAEDVSLSLSPGEVVGLIAPNGYGKTTLMRALAGEAAPLQAGGVSADGVLPSKTPYARKVLWVPGDDSLLQRGLGALAHLRLAGDLWGSSLDAEAVAHAVGVDRFPDATPRKLSRGMAQQVSLGIAVMTGAPYLLLDEPMNALDPINARRAAALVRNVTDHGRCVVISSHILEGLDGLCDSYLLIVDRKVVNAAGHERCSKLFFETYGGGDGGGTDSGSNR